MLTTSQADPPVIETVQIKPRRDFWDKLAVISPLMAGLLISTVGTYCTYAYNQQQLKIQRVQTIGNFIPHLMGNEQSKKAAILALSTMTDTETASQFAQIFASSGTVSALQSMSHNGSTQDKQIASQALSSALQNLAQQDSLSKLQDAYTKKLEGMKDSVKGNSYMAYNLQKLAQIYIMRGQYDLAEPLLQRALTLREQLYGADNPEICDTLRSLTELYYQSGKVNLAEANIKRVRAIEQKYAAASTEASSTTPSPASAAAPIVPPAAVEAPAAKVDESTKMSPATKPTVQNETQSSDHTAKENNQG